jgi:hypothetical protein
MLETSAITDLVKSRVYYVKAPPDAVVPYVVIHSISNIPLTPNFDAASGKSTARLQLSIFATTYDGCKDIATAIKTIFNGFKGTMATGGIVVGGCFLENEIDLSFEDSPLQIYGMAIDYIIHY